MENLEEQIKQILLNHNFCDEELLDSCVEELIDLFEADNRDALIERNLAD